MINVLKIYIYIYIYIAIIKLYHKFISKLKSHYRFISVNLIFEYRLKKFKINNDSEKYLNSFRQDVNEEFNKSKINRDLLEDDDYDNKLFEIMTDRIKNYSVYTLRYDNHIMIDNYKFTLWDKFICLFIKLKSYFIAFKYAYKEVISEPYGAYMHRKRFQKIMDKHFKSFFASNLTSSLYKGYNVIHKNDVYKRFSNSMYNSILLHNNMKKK